MNKGIVIYAHNNRKVDYALMAVIAGGLAKKNLGVPVSIITDQSTVEWMQQSGIYEKADALFDKIILVDRPITDNQRRLHDGVSEDIVPFLNSNRTSVWDLTPYDRTLLIDSDYLIFSNHLNEYWDVDQDVMIGESINDITNNIEWDTMIGMFPIPELNCIGLLQLCLLKMNVVNFSLTWYLMLKKIIVFMRTFIDSIANNIGMIFLLV